ncbi:hypothetical protein B0H14DRAFT_2973505 [Mycena olivaceomarginata]|nr:hypothetical protein B0H14DRAFT_2973505 [Mycena olivaceomarginata]
MQCTHGTHPNFLGLLSDTDTHSCTYHEYIRPALERRPPHPPPLRTLNLLPPCAQRQGDSVYDSYDRPCPTLNVPHHPSSVHVHVLIDITHALPHPLRRGSLSSATSSSSSSSSSSKLTLVPCASFEDAEAVRPLAKGTRVHPYRIARRRASA